MEEFRHVSVERMFLLLKTKLRNISKCATVSNESKSNMRFCVTILTSIKTTVTHEIWSIF